jgi:hypothetical protein
MSPKPDPIGAALDRLAAHEAEKEAERLAAEQAAQAERTTPSIIREAITGSSGIIPLKGEAVLRAALSGMGTSGSINGQIE